MQHMNKIGGMKFSGGAPIGSILRGNGIDATEHGTSGARSNETVTSCQMICESTTIWLVDDSIITLIGAKEIDGKLFKIPKRGYRSRSSKQR
jgi:hypothetical protein